MASITRNYLNNEKVQSTGREKSKQDSTIRLMTFNVLAQGLSGGNFVKCPTEALVFERRFDALLQEITQYSADIICLQEVDMYEQLSHKLSEQGYSGLWKGKPDSPTLRFAGNMGPDGSAVFYRNQAFKLVSKHAIAGDLNSVPTEPVHNLIRSAGFESSFVAATGAEPEYTTCKIRSKGGADDVQRYIGDYIYYKNTSDKQKSMTVSKVLEIPAEEKLGEGKLPSLQYPSDHLSQVAELLIT